LGNINERAPRPVAGVGCDPRRPCLGRARLAGVRLFATVLSCLALAAGAAACGSSTSSSSSTSTSTSTAAAATSTAASTTASSSSASGSGGSCGRLQAASTPAVTAGSTPKLSALERKALQGAQASAFQFSGRTCLATGSPAQLITLNGVASLHPNLVVEGHETIAGRHVEVRFIGSKIYIYLAEIASRDGGKPWLVADLKRLSSASGLDFSQLLDQVRQLSPNGPSPLLKAASLFHPLGRATVSGQTVYVFQGSFAPSDLTKLGLSANLAKQTAAKLRQLGATKEEVTSYVNGDGVALRTIAAIYKGSQLLTVSISSSARLGRTIIVKPPPASKTVDYSKAG
jgi:hypothetical protein